MPKLIPRSKLHGVDEPPEFKTIVPVPDSAGDPPKSHRAYGNPEFVYEYRTTNDKLAGYVYRFETREGKQVLPVTFVHNSKKNKNHWIYRTWDGKTPLYGQQRISKNKKAAVLIVEGEKCCDVAVKLLQDFLPSIVPVCWCGGTGQVGKVDFSALKGRKVIIWPDADCQINGDTGNPKPFLEQPGIKAALNINDLIKDISDGVRIIIPNPNKKSGWDIADAVEAGANPQDTIEFIKQKASKYESVLLYGRTHPFSGLNAQYASLDAEYNLPEPVADQPLPPAPPLPKDQPIIVEEIFKLTDSVNADFFFDMHRHTLRFDSTSQIWLLWNHRHWEYDLKDQVYNKARETAREIYNVALGYGFGSDEYKLLLRNAAKAEDLRGLRNMITIASKHPAFAKLRTDFDQNLQLINVANGTIDLKTCKLRPHDSRDMLTKCLPIHYDESKKCPMWEKFIARIFDADEHLIRFIQRAVGYSMTGSVSEQCLFFSYGTGANGKSVFFETMQMLFCDYWQKAPTNMLMISRNSSNGGPNPEIARLANARFVVASEVDESNVFNESLIKDLTGGDTLVARFLNKNLFEFKPTHKLWIYGNHKPGVRGNDRGIWRRIMMIPFQVTIPDSEKRKPEDLKAEFKAELPGILNWALEGLRDYNKNGLNPPEIVVGATKEYRKESDTIGIFLDDCCDVGEGLIDTYKDLFTCYKEWAHESKEYCHRKKNFALKLVERGFERKKGTANVDMFWGLKRKVTEETV